jgi:hypothetical protein
VGNFGKKEKKNDVRYSMLSSVKKKTKKVIANFLMLLREKRTKTKNI